MLYWPHSLTKLRRCEFHLLLWNVLLPELRHQEPLHHLRHHRHRQRHFYHTRSLPRREMGSSPSAHVRRNRHVRLPTDCRDRRHHCQQYDIKQGLDRICLLLHLLLCVLVGALRLGCDWYVFNPHISPHFP